ncbi:MAG: ATP-binding protein [Dehalococcoidia bacterium]|nr:ATP-binding protein [Dehalococcoidia bacterium]
MPAIFEHVHQTLRQALAVDVLVLRAPGDDGETLISGDVAADIHGAELSRLVSPLGRSTRLLRTDFPDPFAERLGGAGIEHLLVAPLCRDSEAPGMMVLGRQSRLFTDTESDYVDVVAALLGQALAARERLERDRRELQEQRTLSWLLAAAAHETDPQQLSHAFALQLQSLVDEPVVGFGFLDASGTVTFDLPGGETLKVPMSPSNVDDGRDQWVHESIPGDYDGRDFLRAIGVQSFVVTAARVGGSTLGYLVVGSRVAGYRFDEGVLGLLQLVAQLTGPAMQHAREAQAVERERALLQLTLGSLSEGIMLLDNDLNVAYHNDFGSHIARSIPIGADAQGRPEFLLPRDVASQLRTAAETRTAAGGRWKGRIAGEERWLDYQFLPLEHSEYRLVCVVQDATEAVQRETEQERHREELERAGRLAALGGLIGGVAHELNNPLTSIMGLAELLVENMEEGPERDDLLAMQREAERARKIVQDLLFMARPAPVERQPFTVDSLLGHIERVRQNSWLRAGIDVRIEAADREALLYGSEDRMTQVLLNLITNAEEAVSGRESPWIAIRVSADEGGATIEVEDNGEGIEEETTDHIFEPFFTTREGSGTGLGLSVSHGIVQAHEGRIEVDSTPGEGPASG